mgnify:CR=1 FL=1|tara:strand:+ start:6772 stop:7341 length:570 start_codon:yes stop_codon:yes gene_type:complete
MADTLESVLNLSLIATFKQSLANSGGTVEVPIKVTKNLRLLNGTSADQADKAWGSLGRALTTSATEDIDLYDLGTIDIGPGAGRDPLGQDVTYAELVMIYIGNATTSTGSLLIGGKAAGTAQLNTFLAVAGTASDTAQIGPIPPGGFVVLYAPAAAAFAVADATNHLLAMTESGVGALTYDIVVWARSA